eukprot:gene13172-17648_t
MNSASGRNLKIDVEGGFITYDLVQSGGSGGSPIVFLPGLVRTKNSAKSINLQSLCKKSDLTFLGADYYGVGKSSGQFTDGSVGRWTNDTISLIDKAIGTSQGKVILVGHGVGAWVSFLIAKKRPDLVSGIVGLSADPDFTEELLWKNLSEDVKERIMKEGQADITWGQENYPITKNLIEDGRKNLLLAGGPGSIHVSCPIRLIHSLEDEEVPYQLALKLAESCASSDVSVMLVKGSSHAMEGDREFHIMRMMIKEVMDAFNGEFDLRSPASG